MRRLVCSCCLFLFAHLLTAVPAQAIWTDIGAGLTGVSRAAAAWGDYDSDGDLDLVIAGLSLSSYHTRLYRNDGGTTFVPTSALPVAVTNAALAWGDYDRDGDLDLAIAGLDSTSATTRVLRNDDSSFVDIGAPLAGAQGGDVAWGDYDNDGDLDLAVAGTGTAPLAKIYRNTTTGFVDAITLAGMGSSALAWGDYDGDGDLDLLILGQNGTSAMTALYRNDAGGATMTAVATGIPGLQEGAAAWGDYDNDGDLDLAISGRVSSTSGGSSSVYRNSGGSFVDVAAGLQGVYASAMGWGDYDNDGDLDLLVSGRTASAASTSLYRNTSGTFAVVTTGLPQFGNGALAWGDHDGDGDLDLAVAGLQNNVTPIARIYRNNDALGPNTRPSAPNGLSFTSNGTTATFAWSASGDAQGGSSGLHYNLRVGSAPGASDLVAPMARGDGWRRVASGGNAGQRLAWSMPTSALGGGNVYWSVQAIDQAYAGSAFANEQTVGVENAEPTARFALRVEGAHPFRGEARILCTLADAGPVALTVHDPSGRRVRSLVRGMLPAGTSRWIWRGDDDRGRACPPGIYLVHLRGKGASASLRIAKLR
jgi:hypothetical protein